MADYSFALEYDGPPVQYAIPRAIPLDLDRIPVASAAAPSVASDSSGSAAIPVVHPLPSPLPSKPSSFSPTSVIETGAAMDRSAELTEDAGETSGPVESTIPDRISTGSASPLCSEFDFRSSGEEDGDGEGQGQETLAYQANQRVTFQDELDSPLNERPAKPYSARISKKGACYWCLKGNRFTEKESCISCDAKYCLDCILRAMGSMPEGRKCLTCIGSPILENKRERLGKSSRILKRLLSSLEVQQVMLAERTCEANMLRPEDIYVNGRKLDGDELALLQNCACPPPRLKPGYYWYDKVSGYWGKEGHKPQKIITADLNVGGNLQKNASNGNTGICINGREITKSERQMLKLAGVQCAGKPQFWVNADGSYQEEGQKKIIGYIWGKPIMKLLCPVLSLPTPTVGANPNPIGDEMVDLVNRVASDFVGANKTIQKLLLVGYEGSGTSTIFKQAKFLYKSTPFSKEEREGIKQMIQTNLYSYLGILLEGREMFEEEILHERRANGNNEETTEYSLGPRLRGFSDWLLKVMASGTLDAIFLAATREYARLVVELWNDPAVQSTYNRRSELNSLPPITGYFLQQVVDICRMDYEPSDRDILCAGGLTWTNGIASTNFSFSRSRSDSRSSAHLDDPDQPDSLLRYQLIRVHSRGLGDKCKWLDMFEEVNLVIFCISLTDYSEYLPDPNGGPPLNKMLECKKLFESIITHPTFQHMNFLLILNKFDLLEQIIERSPLTQCDWFADFNPIISRNNFSTVAQMAYHYIAVRFKRLFDSLVLSKKLYVTATNGLNSDSVDSALRYAREILKWEDEKPVFGGSSDTIYSTEPSSYSH